MASMTAEQIAVAFNDAINAGDLDALESLMTEDHRFVDSDGASIDGRHESIEAWRGFFDAFPDYRNHFELIVSLGHEVVISGSSTCQDERLTGPALWSVRVTDGRVSEWRVHDDSPENRTDLGVPRPSGEE